MHCLCLGYFAVCFYFQDGLTYLELASVTRAFFALFSPFLPLLVF